ncbi:MAG: Sec-independent protein translocase subunit TatC, partial [Billgrantia desiderata]
MSDSDDKQDLGQAPLIEHLIELRSRLLRSVVAIFVIFLG